MRFRIKGQVSGGKNNMGVTKTGIHYPKKKFVEWRTQAEWQLKKQIKAMPDFETITEPSDAVIHYVSGDLRRRDCTAIMDALFHVLERMNIVKDDTFIGGRGKQLLYTNDYDKKNPYIEIIFGGKDER